MEGPYVMLFTPIIPTITVFAQLVVEYGTLSPRGRPALHAALRASALLLVYGGAYLLDRAGVRSLAVYYLLPLAHYASCLILFKESLAQKTFLYFADWGISSFLSSTCAWIASWLAGGDGGEPAIRALIYAAAYLVALPLYLRCLRGRVREMLALFQKGNPLYAAYPVLAFVVFIVLFGPAREPPSAHWFAVMVLFECIVLFSYYLLFSQIHAVVDRVRAEDHLRATERHAQSRRKYYEEVELGLRRQRELLHDTRHHLVAMSSLLERGDHDRLGAYLRGLLEKTGSEYSKRYCANEMANAIIGGYIRIAEEDGIAVSVELDLPESVGIGDFELCTVFGNALENAIEACQRIPESSTGRAARFINLKSRVDKGRLVVRIENSFDSALALEGGRPRSSKGELGGVGLDSIAGVVDRHHGSSSIEASGSTFILSAVLCLEPSPSG